MRFLLIPAPNLSAGRVEPYVPYGLCSLQAVGAGMGAEVDVLDLEGTLGKGRFRCSEDFARALSAAIDPHWYDAIGLSTMCSSFHHTLNAACLIHQRSPGTALWMGGPHCSVHPLRVLGAYPFVTAVFVGEGERSFAAALARLASGDRSLRGIPGVQTRSGHVAAVEPIKDLDTLSFVGDTPGYVAGVLSTYASDPSSPYPLEAERGCPGRCSFCSTSLYWGRRTRRKSDGRILEEMRLLCARTGKKAFSLIGDNFSHPHERLLSFSRLLASSPEEYEWHCSMRLDRLTASDLDLLWEGGCRGFFVGLESASQATLDRIGKGLDLSKQLSLVQAAVDRGFEVVTSFIIGFPWETSEDRAATYHLHKSMVQMGVLRSQILALCFLPGTELERDYREQAIPGGLSRSALDDTAYGDGTRQMMERCPELFTQFRYVPSGSSRVEIGATLTAASMLQTHYADQRKARSEIGANMGLRRNV